MWQQRSNSRQGGIGSIGTEKNSRHCYLWLNQVSTSRVTMGGSMHTLLSQRWSSSSTKWHILLVTCTKKHRMQYIFTWNYFSCYSWMASSIHTFSDGWWFLTGCTWYNTVALVNENKAKKNFHNLRISELGMLERKVGSFLVVLSYPQLWLLSVAWWNEKMWFKNCSGSWPSRIICWTHNNKYDQVSIDKQLMTLPEYIEGLAWLITVINNIKGCTCYIRKSQITRQLVNDILGQLNLRIHWTRCYDFTLKVLHFL